MFHSISKRREKISALYYKTNGKNNLLIFKKVLKRIRFHNSLQENRNVEFRSIQKIGIDSNVFNMMTKGLAS